MAIFESPLDCKEIQPFHPKGNQFWICMGRADAEAETPILWSPDSKNWYLKRPWCWERLKVRGEGDNRGWDGWISSPTQWTSVWASSESWRWTGKPSILSPFHKELDMTKWLNCIENKTVKCYKIPWKHYFL